MRCRNAASASGVSISAKTASLLVEQTEDKTWEQAGWTLVGKALKLGLKPIVIINKVDKPNCTPDEVHEQVFDLMFTLEANEDQLDFPVVYGSSKQGWMGPDWKNPTEDVSYLLDMILEHIPAPKKVDGSLQMRITSLDYSSFQGRIAVGRPMAVASPTAVDRMHVHPMAADAASTFSPICAIVRATSRGSPHRWHRRWRAGMITSWF